MPWLVAQLLKLAKRRCPVHIRHADGKLEEGRLHRVLFNKRTGTIRIFLRDHMEKALYQRRFHFVEPTSRFGRPIIFKLEHAEFGQSPGRFDITLDGEGDGEYHFSLSINTIL